MKRFKEGDKITVEDIHAILEEAKKNSVDPEKTGIKPRIENGVLVFESDEDIEKYYGGLFTLDEVFKEQGM